jgi:hypothetical protein
MPIRVERVTHQQSIRTVHDSQHHVSFTQRVRHVHMVRVSTSVYDSVHVQVQVVKLGQESRICHDLVDLRIALTDPSVKL